MTNRHDDTEPASEPTMPQRRDLIRGGAAAGVLPTSAVLGLGGAQAQPVGSAPAPAANVAHNPPFSGKVAFVTGSSSGIGRATALAFAREGAQVALVDIQGQANEETARMIQQAGGRALAITGDVSRGEVVEAAVKRTTDAFGRLDFAFNKASIEQASIATADLTEAEWDRLMANNLRSVFLCMKHQIPVMVAQGGGVIVNTSSGAGIKGFAGQAAYAATKHGMIGLSKSAALEYAKAKVRVNVVCPGIIDTPMSQRVTAGSADKRAQMVATEPVGRFGRPEEIASSVLWLCQDNAAFTTGAAIVVDGGQTV